jgi:hypothetical protein
MPPILCILALLSAAAVVVLRFAGARWEYGWGFFITGRADVEDWSVHHDEKLMLAHARYAYLCDKAEISLDDYGPWPVAPSFGVGAPGLIGLGFRLFGFNNQGLRAPFIALTAATDLILAATLSAVAGTTGFIAAILLCCNVSHFILARHAIVEHFLTLVLTLHAAWCLIDPDGYRAALPLAVGLSGVAVIFKPHFPVYVTVLAACLSAGLGVTAGEWWTAAAAGIGGALVFEGAHLLWLSRLGIARWRYHNLKLTILQHQRKWDVPVPGYCAPPPKWKILWRFFQGFVEWFDPAPGPRSRQGPAMRAVVVLILALFFGLGVFSWTTPEAAPATRGLFLFFCAMLLALAPFYYYLKRAVPLYPLLLACFAIGLHDALAAVAPWAPRGETDLLLTALPLTALFVLRHGQALAHVHANRSAAVADNSRRLNEILPPGATVYAHAYGYRFFWMADGVRLLSSDDQFMNNGHILDAAAARGCDYVLLADAGPEQPVPVIELAHFSTRPRESDYWHTYRLFRIGRAAEQAQDERRRRGAEEFPDDPLQALTLVAPFHGGTEDAALLRALLLRFGGPRDLDMARRFIDTRLPAGRLFIYGAGVHTNEIFDALNRNSRRHLLGVVDRRAAALKTYRGLPVITPEDLPGQDFDYILVSYNRDEFDITRSLSELGIAADKIMPIYTHPAFVAGAMLACRDDIRRLAGASETVDLATGEQE